MPQSTLLNLQRLALLLVLVVAFTGCGRVAFVSERYDNFTAYYNTFYNAEKSFTEGLDALEQTEQPIDRQVYISVFEAPGQNTSDQRFQAAVDKSADVLREHPDSKWVDDALLLIGKSYFYQQNYVGAEQKFGEVIVMASPLEDEARLWLARTLIAAGAHDEARQHLLASLNREDLSKRWEPSLRLALGELHVKRADYDAAIEELVAGLESVRDNQIMARASFLLGQVYETVGRYEDAVEAYQDVLDGHPRYELSYAALYSAARVQGLHVDSEAALQSLRRMERDDKNYSNRSELAYLRGRIYQTQEYADDARALFHEILYDSDGQITAIRGRVHYALAELYRDSYQDYQMAAAHFDTARTALQTSAPVAGGRRSTLIEYAPEAITDAAAKSEMFGSFADVRAQLAEMDSLLYLGSLDDDEFMAKILEIRQQLAEDMAEEERRAARLQAERGFREAAASGGADGNERTSNAAATAAGSSGFLFHRDPIRVQEGRMNFIARWGERPLAPNWRRIEAIQNVAATVDSAGPLRGRILPDLDPGVGENPLPPVDYSNVPRDSLSKAAMRAQRAAARYELANVLFLLMDEPDSAATWYRTVIEEDADFPVAQRAFYALAEVHSSLGDSLAARRLYEQVLEDYPKSDFAGRVRERLGIRDDVPSDTLDLAEEDYGQAYQRWRRGSYQQALDHMVEVAASYPRMEVAPRALLAAGHIFMEWAQRDSMDIFGPIPLTVPDSTLGSAGLLGIFDAPSPPGEPSPPAPDSVEAQTGTPYEDRSGATSLPDEDVRPSPEDASAAVSESKNVSEPPVDERPVGNIPRQNGARSTDSTSAHQPPDVLTRTQEELGDSRDSIPTDSAGVGLANDSLMTPAGSRRDRVADSRNPDDSPARGDSLAPADSLALAHPGEADLTGSTAADSTASLVAEPAEGDAANTSRMPDDSVAVANDTTAASGTNAAATEEEHIYLKTLYTGVKQNYPETAYAEHAGRLLKALQERESEISAVEDSIAAAAAASADSAAGLVAYEKTRLDSLGTGADSLAAATDSTIAGGTIAAIDTTSAVDVNSAIDRSSDTDVTAATDVAAAIDTAAVAYETATDDSTGATNAAAGAEKMDVTSAAAGTDTTAGIDTNETPTNAGETDASELNSASDTTAHADRPFVSPDTSAVAGRAVAEPGISDRAATDAPTGIPAGEEAIRGEGGIRPELGGYTLIIGSDTKEATMRAMLKKYEAQGFRTEVIIDRGGDETLYRAAIGHFASRRDAGEQMQKYAAQITETAQLAPLSDFE